MVKKIGIFDLDDTLTVTKAFVEFLNTKSGELIDIRENHFDYFKKIKALFWDKLSKPVMFRRDGDFVVAVNPDEGNKAYDGSYMDYFSDDKKALKMFEVKNDTLVIRSFPGFHSDPQTIGAEINESIYDEYKKFENKMILTGRDEKLRSKLEDNLKELGVEFPNYGFELFPGGSVGIKVWKSEVILKSIEENQWEEVHYFEDRQDWLNAAEGRVKERFPNVKFVAHFVSNVKDQHKF